MEYICYSRKFILHKSPTIWNIRTSFVENILKQIFPKTPSKAPSKALSKGTFKRHLGLDEWSCQPVFNFIYRNANETILWDEGAIEVSLRQYVSTAFDDTDTAVFDTFDSTILQNSSNLTQDQKDAALLWASWKSQVTLMASLLSNGAQVYVSWVYLR